MKSKDITTVTGLGVKPEQTICIPGNNRAKFCQGNPLDALIVDNLEKSLATTVDKYLGNSSGSIVVSLIKIIPSKMFRDLAYYIYVTGPLIRVYGTHAEFFNSDFEIWMGKKHFSHGCCRPIRIHKVWRALGKSPHGVEQLSILRHKVATIQGNVATKQFHGGQNIRDKRGRNKVRIYTSTYAPGADH